ncbi:hypothetical protein [Tritonibacter mobilis]|uniref:hypothetical protein n=1 Tax=Tritonibacter mobilis TaxID=379347 RepID=UPI001CD98B83|nr:hypothetical protein [Tritonibacter mobilis]MCA2009825.1 hypothetical protein [Tritonibacter mobilis]
MKNKIGNPMLFFLSAVFWGIGGIAFFFLFYTIFASQVIYNKTPEGSDPIAGPIGTGLFGDAFGFVTSMFTGAAFIGLMITMVLQRQELKATNEALDDQRKTNRSLLMQAKAEQLEQRFYVLLEQVRTKSRNSKLEILKYSGRPEQVIELIERLSKPDVPLDFTEQSPVTTQYYAFIPTDKSEIFGLIFSSGATEAMLANQTLNEIRSLDSLEYTSSEHIYVDKLSHLLADAIPPEIATLYALALARSMVRHGKREPNFFNLLKDLILQTHEGQSVEGIVSGYISQIEERLTSMPEPTTL